jgi:hypothetical protein
MLRKLRNLQQFTIRVLNGDPEEMQGLIQRFRFDETTWQLRSFKITITRPAKDMKVWIPSSAFEVIDWEKKALSVSLSKIPRTDGLHGEGDANDNV